MTSFIDVYRKDFLTSASLVVWPVLTLSLGLSGPFGPYEALPWRLRLVFWGRTIGVGVLRTWTVGKFIARIG